MSALPAPLLDGRGRALEELRLSVIDQCNFRCRYCLPSELFEHGSPFLADKDRLTLDELEAIARGFIELGVRKIRLTGGEPLLFAELPELVQRLHAAAPDLDLTLTTNGLRLATLIEGLRARGLSRVNVSLDALDPAVLRAVSGRTIDPEKILQGIRVARDSGLPVKVNMVVMAGINESQIVAMARRMRDEGVALRYIEYMDVGNSNGWSEADVVRGKTTHARLAEVLPLQPYAEGRLEGVARICRYLDGAGTVGFINSVSQPFCSGCTRARVSADGTLYGCLFANKGLPLRPLLRTGKPLAEALIDFWSQRDDRYSELRGQDTETATGRRAEMWQLGG